LKTRTASAASTAVPGYPDAVSRSALLGAFENQSINDEAD